MAIDDRGRWKAGPGEPFNAGLGGFDPQRIHDAMEPGGDGCALSALWAIALAVVVLGVIGPSVFFDVLGSVLLLISLRWTIRHVRQARSRTG